MGGLFNNRMTSTILILVVFIALMYFMMIRPQKKKEKEDAAMRGALKVGDEISTIGGVVGKVVKITDKTVVITTGSDKSKIEFLKLAIATVNSSSNSKASSKKTVPEPVEDQKGPEAEKKVAPKKLTKKKD